MTSLHNACFINHNNIVANNIVAITHLIEFNKYHISTFMLEPLAKKVCSVSFVCQYINLMSSDRIINLWTDMLQPQE